MTETFIIGPKRLSGSIGVSGSKNAGLLALAAAVLAETTSVITNLPGSTDFEVFKAIFKHLGHQIDEEHDSLVIEPSVVGTFEVPTYLASRMRASICLLGPLLAKHKRVLLGLPGGCRIGARPVDLHLRALQAMGATVVVDGGRIFAVADQLHGAVTDMRGKFGSSVTATANTLLASVTAKGTSIIRNASREPEVCFLVRCLSTMGARISGAGSSTLKVDGVAMLNGLTINNVYDRLEAATFMFAAAITRGEILIKNAPVSSLGSVIKYLRAAGCCVLSTESSLSVQATSLESHNATCAQYPGLPTDVQALVTALSATIKGTAEVKDAVFPNRFKHLDEIWKFGPVVQLLGNKVAIEGKQHLRSADVVANDIRDSAALILLALRANGQSRIRGANEFLARGYCSFYGKLNALGAEIGSLNAKRVKTISA